MKWMGWWSLSVVNWIHELELFLQMLSTTYKLVHILWLKMWKIPRFNTNLLLTAQVLYNLQHFR
jgi:hypothetical protein